MNKLSVKQAKFVEGIASGKSGVESALQAYDTKDYATANAIAVENLQKPSIQQALAPVYKKLGITIEKALKPVAKALDAKVDHYQTVKVVTGTGKDKQVEYREELVRSEDNIPLQLQGSDRALKLLGVYGQIDKDNSISQYTSDELASLAGASDEIELTKLVFKKL